MLMQPDEVIIEPKGTEKIIPSLLKYKELIYFFTWREFKVRYKEASLGILWVVLQPLLFMVLVNFIIVQRLGARFGDVVPSGFLIFLGFVLWQLFEPSLNGTLNSFLSNQALFKKIYMPKLIPAIANILSRLVDFSIAFILLGLVALIFGYPIPLLTLALLIPGIIVMLLTAYGIGLLLGSLNMRFRDIKQVMPFMMRVLFFGTPIIWPMSIIPEKFQPILYLNPAGAVIESIRRSWYDPTAIRWGLLWLPFITMLIALALGVYVFKKTERDMVDIA